MSPEEFGAGPAARIAGLAASRVQAAGADTLLSLNSTFSIVSLASALLIAALAVAWSRLRRRRRIRLKLLARALRPRRAVLGASGKADLGFFLLNTFSTGGLIGWALLSQSQVAAWTIRGLDAALGPPATREIGPLEAVAASLALFLAYELAYWFDHWLSHRVPCLWEIHKVHHTAEALSPLTNFRVHPLETVKFWNIAAILTGSTFGVLAYGLGHAPQRLELFHADVLFLAFMLTVAHLQHSHVWIAFRGAWGRLLMSPAHHQVHHSTDPRHFGRNLGSALAVWDLVFGTLYVPAARRERLTFGVENETAHAHSVTGTLITPMVRAAETVLQPRRTRTAADREDSRAARPLSA